MKKSGFRYRLFSESSIIRFFVLMLSILSILFSPLSRYIVVAALIGWIILEQILLKGQQKIYAVAVDMISLIIAFAIAFPLCHNSNIIRFLALEEYYEFALTNVYNEIQISADTIWSELKNPNSSLFQCDTIFYRKHQEQFVVYFTISENFFQSYGYLYYNSDEAKGLLLAPNEYFPELSSTPSYDRWIELSDQWAYVKLY